MSFEVGSISSVLEFAKIKTNKTNINDGKSKIVVPGVGLKPEVLTCFGVSFRFPSVLSSGVGVRRRRSSGSSISS